MQGKRTIRQPVDRYEPEADQTGTAVQMLRVPFPGTRVLSRVVETSASTTREVAWNRSRGFDTDTIKHIQRVIGIPDDGIIGPATVAAVRAWQAENGLVADGLLGSNTLAAMDVGGGTPASEPTSPEAPTPGPQAGEGTPGTPLEPGSTDDLAGAIEKGWNLISDWLGNVSGDGRATEPGVEPSIPVAEEPPVDNRSELAQLMSTERMSTEEITRTRELIAVVSDEQQRGDLYEALQAKVVYHSQRDNESTQGGKVIGDVMCNLTSLAMCLMYLGVPNPRPELQYEDALEQIRREEGLPARTLHTGWGGVAEKLHVEVKFIGYNITEGRQWWEANVLTHLRAGHAVMMSISGHIVRVQAISDAGVVVDDPYGASTLGAGESRGWGKVNPREESGEQNVGEDHIYPWSDVGRHEMRWIAWFSV
jgi:peptidoglycan hydrolase-like protein with peptidoglycan-binding domain